MKKRKIIIIIIALVLAIVLVWFLFFRKKTPPIVLQTEKPRYGYISESVTATGTIQPVDTVAVGTQISGTIYKLHADMNDEVKKGLLLAEIDPVLVQATLDQARAVLAQNQSNQALQQKNFNRQKQLYAVGAISKADYDAALNALNAANATVRNAAAQVKSTSKNVSLTKIYSPINGVVLTRNVGIGQTVAASFNTPTLFSIAKDLTNMQVKANVDEADVADLDTALRATFTVDAYLDKEFDGKVREISLQPTVASNVVTYPTFIGTTNTDKKLKPGMTANITIYTHEADSVLLIPVKAIKFRPDSALEKKYKIVRAERNNGSSNNNNSNGSSNSSSIGETRAKSRRNGDDRTHASVWVLQGDQLIQNWIKTGLNNNIDVQVLEGLSADDLVVTGATGGEIGKKAGSSSASPFMPARRGGGGGGQSGGRGGGGPRQ